VQPKLASTKTASISPRVPLPRIASVTRKLSPARSPARSPKAPRPKPYTSSAERSVATTEGSRVLASSTLPVRVAKPATHQK
jgi:hypothetical protein